MGMAFFLDARIGRYSKEKLLALPAAKRGCELIAFEGDGLQAVHKTMEEKGL